VLNDGLVWYTYEPEALTYVQYRLTHTYVQTHQPTFPSTIDILDCSPAWDFSLFLADCHVLRLFVCSEMST
ncbi:unnamed protein product, partial [Urochloa humidicola]